MRRDDGWSGLFATAFKQSRNAMALATGRFDGENDLRRADDRVTRSRDAVNERDARFIPFG
jgi:hypothetical protein